MNIIILQGGPSPEAAVSRSTAAGMATAVAKLGYSHEVWELEGNWLEKLTQLPKQETFVLLALYGCPGEDGTVQGALNLLGLPYQGSGPAASAVAMDKIISRTVLKAAGLPVAEGLWGEALENPEEIANFLEKHGRIVVKPATAGSSVGVSIVSSLSGWPAAYAKAAEHGPVLVEEYVAGKELTVGCLQGEALPVIEIGMPPAQQGAGLYDYTAKYTAGGSTHTIPALVGAETTATLQRLAVETGKALGLAGAYRADFRYNPTSGHIIVLEANTLPGMTPTSLLPDAAANVGLAYAELVGWMIENGQKQKR